MVKSLAQYLAENEVTHEFRVKFAVEPTDKQLDSMETHLRKYDAFDVETPQKTIMQRNPRDFRHHKAAEIFYVDFKSRLPAAPHMLLAEISQITGISERNIVVRNKMEPLHLEDDNDEPVEDYTTRLTDEEYTEHEDPKAEEFYGEEFKSSFLQELEKIRVEHTKEADND